jgi:NifU-like protein involved in Fe-S cluster formation
MTADGDLMKLYSQRILALAADVPHAGRMEAPDATARRRSPLCGSTVTMDVRLGADGRITDIAQDVRACALGQASAAIAGAALPGRSLTEIEAARDTLRAMLTAGGPVPPAPFDGYEALIPARDYRNRHASIMLALEAAAEAVASAQQGPATARAGGA